MDTNGDEFDLTTNNGSTTGFTAITGTNGEWDNLSTWTGEFGSLTQPGPGHNVTINSGGTITIDAGAQANTVTITDDAHLTLNAATTLDVTGDFVIESGGSFIQNGALNAASKTAKRYIGAWSAADDGWHLLASPVYPQSINPEFTGAEGTYDFFAWDEPNTTWDAFGAGFTGENFEQGIGYLVAYDAEDTKQFSGDFNSDDYTKSLTRQGEGDYAGFNLLGNPYPCALTWSTGWSLGNVQSTAYVWNESTKDYKSISAGEIIPAMNGFMVYLTSGTSQDLNIPASARVHDNTSWYKHKTMQEQIVLKAHDPSNESAKEHVIRFNESATEGYDAAYDAVYIAGYAPDLYSSAGNKSLMVNALPAYSSETIIPLSFQKNEGSSNYTITLVEGLNGQELYLEDLKTNTIIDLSETGAYNFSADAGDDPGRFQLKFSTVGIDNPNVGEVNVYSNNHKLVVENIKHQTTISVYNLEGQLMKQIQTANDHYEKYLDLPDGIYMVRLQSNEMTQSKKIILK
ncbi:MAG: T9SS type A sorting domain-containing protein [Bacteroidales bacterium]|nr:T9SS type A sorting domain-containing protein [Bacteroidales bacterium]